LIGEIERQFAEADAASRSTVATYRPSRKYAEEDRQRTTLWIVEEERVFDSWLDDRWRKRPRRSVSWPA